MEGNHLRMRALVSRMDDLRRRCERERDPRAVFTYVYSIMTTEVDRHLEAMSLFDPAWIVELAEAFAARYFAAVEAADTGRSPGRAWQAVFDALRTRSSVLEDTVFPMTVHIVHDLPLALLDVGLDGAVPGTRLHDYDQVNRVMERSIDVIRHRVTRRYSPGLRFLDKMESRYDLVLSAYGIRMSRGQAWYDALRLRDPTVSDAARSSLESRPVELVKCVRHRPDSLTGLALALLRRVVCLFRRWPTPRVRAR
jgi:hypothetical protein